MYKINGGEEIIKKGEGKEEAWEVKRQSKQNEYQNEGDGSRNSFLNYI